MPHKPCSWPSLVLPEPCRSSRLTTSNDESTVGHNAAGMLGRGRRMVIKRQRTRLSFLWRAVGKHCCHAAFVRRRLDWRYDGLIRRADCMWRAVKPVIRRGLAQACQVIYVSQSVLSGGSWCARLRQSLPALPEQPFNSFANGDTASLGVSCHQASLPRLNSSMSSREVLRSQDTEMNVSEGRKADECPAQSRPWHEQSQTRSRG
jgi:hypothetical protein